LFLHSQPSADLWLYSEQANGIEQHAELECEVTAGGLGFGAKGTPLFIAHLIDEDSVLLVPEDSILGVPGSIVLHDFEDTIACLFLLSLPEFKKGLVYGVLGK
jgi:hypothetical protein